MLTVHVIAAWALVLLNAAAGVWGLVIAQRRRPSRTYAHLLAAAQYIVVVVGLAGLALLPLEARPDDPLHARVYGPFMIVALVAAYGFRGSDPVRNTRLFAVTALIIAALGVRAIQTG